MGSQGRSPGPFVSLLAYALLFSLCHLFFISLSCPCLCPSIFLSLALCLLTSFGLCLTTRLSKDMRSLISASPASLVFPLSPSLQTDCDMAGLFTALTGLVPVLTDPNVPIANHQGREGDCSASGIFPLGQLPSVLWSVSAGGRAHCWGWHCVCQVLRSTTNPGTHLKKFSSARDPTKEVLLEIPRADPTCYAPSCRCRCMNS